MIDIKLSHKVLVLPVMAALGLVLVFAIIAIGDGRARTVRTSALTDEMRRIVTSADAEAWSRFESEIDRADRIDRTAERAAGILVIAFVVVLGATTLIINRYIGIMLRRTLRVLQRISAGDLTARMNAGRHDEIGQAGDALDHLFPVSRGPSTPSPATRRS